MYLFNENRHCKQPILRLEAADSMLKSACGYVFLQKKTILVLAYIVLLELGKAPYQDSCSDQRANHDVTDQTCKGCATEMKKSYVICTQCAGPHFTITGKVHAIIVVREDRLQFSIPECMC